MCIFFSPSKETCENQYLEETYGSILSGAILSNMKIISKKAIVQPEAGLKIRNTNVAFIDDYPIISKMNNPFVIMEYIKMYKKEMGVTLSMKDIPNATVDVYMASRKRKVVAF